MRKRKPLFIAALAIIGLLIWRFLPGRVGEAGTLVVSGAVEGTEARIGSPLAGQIVSVTAREGDLMATDAVLAQFDTAELEARRAQAMAQIGLAQATLEELENGARPEEVAQARATLQAAEERLADGRRDVERSRTLFEGGAISRESLDKAMTAVAVAENEAARASAALRLVEAGPRRERIAAQRAQLARAEAALAEIEASLARSTVRAPFSGVVTVRHREPGEVVGAGAPIVTLLDQSDRWVRVYLPENRIGAVGIGSRAAITADTYPDRVYTGTVTHIAAQAEFTPRSVQTAEERVKLVYAVKVRIVGDEGYELKPGMPADVRLEIEKP